jgi:hypothetical protein
MEKIKRNYQTIKQLSFKDGRPHIRTLRKLWPPPTGPHYRLADVCHNCKWFGMIEYLPLPLPEHLPGVFHCSDCFCAYKNPGSCRMIEIGVPPSYRKNLSDTENYDMSMRGSQRADNMHGPKVDPDGVCDAYEQRPPLEKRLTHKKKKTS